MKTTYMKDVDVKGPMADRVRNDGKRNLMLRPKEKKQLLRAREIETAVSMFLTLDSSKNSYDAIAKEIGRSLRYLKEMTKSEDFIDIWNEHFVELGHDPRLRASQAAITDLLSSAVVAIGSLVKDPTTTGSVRLAAAKEIFRLNGITEPKVIGTDKNELTQFLKEANVTVNQNNLNMTLPSEFADKIHEYADGYFDVPSLPVSNVEEVET